MGTFYVRKFTSLIAAHTNLKGQQKTWQPKGLTKLEWNHSLMHGGMPWSESALHLNSDIQQWRKKQNKKQHGNCSNMASIDTLLSWRNGFSLHLMHHSWSALKQSQIGWHYYTSKKASFNSKHPTPPPSPPIRIQRWKFLCSHSTFNVRMSDC